MAPRTDKNLRAGLYARVSTEDRGQDPETQLRPLREYAERRGFAVVGEYVDHASGTTEHGPGTRGCSRPPASASSMSSGLALRPLRPLDPRLVNALGEFKARGVAFISYQENVDTTTPQGELVFGMMANLAQFESALIGERVKAGMARAKAQGRRTSRPPIPEATRRRIAELHGAGMSIKRIAKELKIAYGTAWNYIKGTGGISTEL
jgi:DNA invertase Pin-like site-specific DNA recombinase